MQWLPFAPVWVSWHGSWLRDAFAYVVDVCAYVPVGNVDVEVVTRQLASSKSFCCDPAECVDPLVKDDRLRIQVGSMTGRGKGGVCILVYGFVGYCVFDGSSGMFLMCFV